MSFEIDQLREAEGIISGLRITNEELNMPATHLFAQMLEMQKKAAAIADEA